MNKSIDEIVKDAKKIAALAESEAELGHEECAKNIAAKLQKLLLRHKLSMVDLEGVSEAENEEVGRTRVNWGEFNVPESRKRCNWIEILAGIVSRAHGCRFLVHSGSNRITLIGKPSNCKVAEYSLGVLVRCALQVSESEYNKYYNECYKNDETWKAKGYRSAWLDGFVSRVRQRFDEEKKKSEKKADESRALVLVRDDLREVEKWMEGRFGMADSLSGRRSYNQDGYRDGSNYANSLNLNQKGVGGSSKGTKKLT